MTGGMPQPSANKYGAAAYAWTGSSGPPGSVSSGGPPGSDDFGDYTPGTNEAVNFTGTVSYSVTGPELDKLLEAHRLIETATLNNPEGFNALFLDRRNCDDPQHLANAVVDVLRFRNDIFAKLNIVNWLTVVTHMLLNPASSNALALLTTNQQLNEQTNLREDVPVYRDIPLSELMSRMSNSYADASDEDLLASFPDEPTAARETMPSAAEADKARAADEVASDGGDDAEDKYAPKVLAGVPKFEHSAILSEIIDHGDLDRLDSMTPEEMNAFEAAVWAQLMRTASENAHDYQLGQPVHAVRAALEKINARMAEDPSAALSDAPSPSALSDVAAPLDGPPPPAAPADAPPAADPPSTPSPPAAPVDTPTSTKKPVSYSTRNPAPASCNWADLTAINAMELPYKLPTEYEPLYELYKESMLKGLSIHPLNQDVNFANLRPALSVCQTALAKVLPMPLVLLATEIDTPRQVCRFESSGRRRSLIGLSVRLTKPIMSPVSWTFSEQYSSCSGQFLSIESLMGSLSRSINTPVEPRLDCRAVKKAQECQLPAGVKQDLNQQKQKNKDHEYMAIVDPSKTLNGFAMTSGLVACRLYAENFVSARRDDLVVKFTKTQTLSVDCVLRERLSDQWKAMCLRRAIPTVSVKKESSSADDIITAMSELRQWANQVLNPQDRNLATDMLIKLVKLKRSHQQTIIDAYNNRSRVPSGKRKHPMDPDDDSYGGGTAAPYGSAPKRRHIPRR